MPIGYSDIDFLRKNLTDTMMEVQKYQAQVKDQPNGGGRELAMLYSQLQVSRGFLCEIPAEEDEVDKSKGS
jgi:hypothetical protein